MKIQHWNEMMKYLTRPSRKVTEEKARKELKLPKDTKLTGSKMLNWINYNNKMFGDNKQPITEDEKKVAKAIEAEQNKEEKWTYTSWADGLEKRTRPEAKKILVAKKPKPTAIELLEFEDYLNTLDPQYWIPEEKPKPPEDKSRIKRTGITKLI